MLSAQLMLFMTVVILVFISWRRKRHPTSVFKSSPEAWSPMSYKTAKSVLTHFRWSYVMIDQGLRGRTSRVTQASQEDLTRVPQGWGPSMSLRVIICASAVWGPPCLSPGQWAQRVRRSDSAPSSLALPASLGQFGPKGINIIKNPTIMVADIYFFPVSLR